MLVKNQKTDSANHSSRRFGEPSFKQENAIQKPKKQIQQIVIQKKDSANRHSRAKTTIECYSETKKQIQQIVIHEQKKYKRMLLRNQKTDSANRHSRAKTTRECYSETKKQIQQSRPAN